MAKKWIIAIIVFIISFFLLDFFSVNKIKISRAQEESICEATNGGTCYYISSNGDDSNPGISPDQAWARLQKVGPYVDVGEESVLNPVSLQPGDVVYLMGGTYTIRQYLYINGSTSGTAASPITIKAYPGQKPILYGTGQQNRAWINLKNTQWWIIEGLEIHNQNDNMLNIINLKNADYVTLRDIEVDGMGATNSNNGILVLTSDYVTIEDCYIHDTHAPTGCEGEGNCSNPAQGESEAIYAANSKFLLIRNNRLERCNHAAISLASKVGATWYGGCRYAKIMNNNIDVRYGGGIYVKFSEYNLIEGNVITHAGGTTYYPKSGIALNSSHNVVRRNVIFSPSGGGLELKSQKNKPSYPAELVYDNLVYNNVIFGTHSTGPDDPNAGLETGINLNHIESADSCVENNTFANNIFYNSIGAYPYYGGGTLESEIVLNTRRASCEHNWLDPCDDPEARPASTNWGGNKFYNNLVRKNDIDGWTYDRIVTWIIDVNLSGAPDYRTYSLEELENNGSISWRNNIGDDPLLISEDPDSYGLTSGWWHLQEGSPAIDAGRVIEDTIGAYVESVAPGWGWSNLSYNGTAPDIGAYEYGETQSQPLPPNLQENYLAVTPTINGSPHLRLYDKDLNLYSQWFAYALEFRKGVNSALGDIDGDNRVEIITGTGPGSAPHVRIFDVLGRLKYQFYAYPEYFRIGLSVTTGDVDGDGIEEIIFAPQERGGPHIRIFKYQQGQFTLLNQFFSYPSYFRMGVNIGAGDLNNDGKEEIIVAPKTRGGPHLKVFQYNTSSNSFSLYSQFFAYHFIFRGGVSLAIGDVDNDNSNEIITGAGPGGGPQVRVFDSQGKVKYQFFADTQSFRGGLDITSFDRDQNGYYEIVTAVYSQGLSQVRIFELDAQTSTFSEEQSFLAYYPLYQWGIRVAGY